MKLAVPASLWTQLGPVPVRLVENCVDSDGKPADGTADVAQRIIEVDTSLSLAMQVQRALHEVSHFWIFDAELRMGRRQEEAVVQTFANGMFNLCYRPPARQRGSRSGIGTG